LELNGVHYLLACADDINILFKNVYMIKKITDAPLEASREVGLEVNTETTKYIFLSRRQNAGQKDSSR
jgi:hypothetical protein